LEKQSRTHLLKIFKILEKIIYFMSNQKIPKGLHQCKICGEYKGKMLEKDLNWGDSFDGENKEKSTQYLSVSCLCDGILCPKCKKNKIHRPISNYYDPKENQIWHIPYFGGMIPCAECRKGNTNLLKEFQNIKWGISKEEFKNIFLDKHWVDYYPEEKNAVTFVETDNNVYISVSAFFIVNNNIHKLAKISLCFYGTDYQRLNDEISNDLFEKNKGDLISIYGEANYINNNLPMELYMSKFINWETKNSKITMALQLSKDYHSLFLSKNILSNISTISTPPSVGINIVDINKEKEIDSYIASQSVIMKQSQQNELEKRLEDFYTPTFQKLMGATDDETKKYFNDVLNRAKEISKQGNTTNLPNNYGNIILREELTNEKIKIGLDKKRAEGVTDEDIKWWWNSTDLERSMALAVDEIVKMATVEGLIKEKGFSEDEAWEKIPKYCPIFCDPYDSSSSDNRYDPLPFELKNRVNVYIEKRIKVNYEQFKKEMEDSPNFNSLIRKEIEKNNL